ncbi:hypothetical protein ACLB2K_043699 [Fragaria x ananassa]
MQSDRKYQALDGTDLSEFVVAIMADLVLGAALGTTFTVLYDAVREATVGKFKTIQPLLRAVESTLASIQPLVIKQIGDYNVKLELPNDEVEKLQKQMREGEELICRFVETALVESYQVSLHSSAC